MPTDGPGDVGLPVHVWLGVHEYCTLHSDLIWAQRVLGSRAAHSTLSVGASGDVLDLFLPLFLDLKEEGTFLKLRKTGEIIVSGATSH